MMEKKYRRYSGDKKSYESMRADLQNFLQTAGVPQKDRLKIELGFEEAAVNVINYSHSPEIYLAFAAEENTVSIDIVDFGTPPFNPLQKDSKAITDSLETQQEGGLGLFFMQKLFQLTYRYEKFSDKMANHLTMLYNIKA